MIVSKWYETSYWRNLMDMHIPDWNPDFMSKFDPERYVELVEESGSDACEFYAGNCLGICFFPTKVGHMHAGLKGRDVLGEVEANLRKTGKTRIIYFNSWSRWAYDTHPSWRIVDIHGHTTLQDKDGRYVGRFGQCCPNNEEYRQHMASQIRQIVTDYDPDGLWIDMCNWHGAVCYCASCREKFYRETGLDLPEKKDWNDPVWMKFQAFREKSIFERNQMLRETAESVKPSITLAFQTSSWRSSWTGGYSEETAGIGDFMAGDYYDDPLVFSAYLKALNQLTKNLPTEFMTSRCTDLTDHTSNKSEWEMRSSVLSSFAHGAAFVFIDAVNPDGTMDERLYRSMGKLKQELSPYYRQWKPNRRIVSDAVFYLNFESNFDAWGTSSNVPKDGHLGQHAMLLAKLMIEHHIPFDFAFRKNLNGLTGQEKVIVLSETAVLNEAEIRWFTSFVENGGRLIVTGLTGMFDRETGRRDDFALKEIIGVKYLGETSEDVVYIRPEGDTGLFGDYTKEAPMMVSAPAVKTELTTAKPLAMMTLPWSRSKEIRHFGSAISNPPGVLTDFPAVTVNSYGKGKVLYVNTTLELEDKAGQREAFANLIRFLMEKEPTVSSDAPSWLELLLEEDGEDGYCLFYLNSMEKFYSASALRVKTEVRLPDVKKIVDAVTGEAVPFESDGGAVTFTLPEITDFKMLRLLR